MDVGKYSTNPGRDYVEAVGEELMELHRREYRDKVRDAYKDHMYYFGGKKCGWCRKKKMSEGVFFKHSEYRSEAGWNTQGDYIVNMKYGPPGFEINKDLEEYEYITMNFRETMEDLLENSEIQYAEQEQWVGTWTFLLSDEWNK